MKTLRLLPWLLLAAGCATPKAGPTAAPAHDHRTLHQEPYPSRVR